MLSDDQIKAVIARWFSYYAPGDDPQPTHQERLDGVVRELRATMLDDIDRLRAERKTMLALIRELVDDGECWFDHHGGCQGHGYLSLKPGEKCPHAAAKELLSGDADAHA